MKVKIGILGYFLAIISLFFYSFTQVDLGLTLTKLSIYQTAEKYFQHIGYFQRPLSTEIYIGLLIFLFAFYFLFLNLARKNLISKKQIWTLIVGTTVVLTFSYNAFSYDLFNYIFDAKIFTFYHQNPYLHRALDYNGEPMLAFMHWVQRTYPYGPTWLGLTIPLSFLGKNIFLLTFFMFKALMSASFLGTVYFLGKILKKLSPKDELLGLVLFSLNPLIIIESLVSSHNDIAMMFFAVWGFYLFMNNKYSRSFILLIISFGVKFATGFMLPVLVGVFVFGKINKVISWEKIVVGICVFMSAAVVVASVRTNFQPWYLLYVLPFSALLPRKHYVIIPTIILSISSLCIYVPFLYSGNWNPPIPMQLFWITTTGILTSTILILASRFKNLLE